jgi:hypothetical protein
MCVLFFSAVHVSFSALQFHTYGTVTRKIHFTISLNSMHTVVQDGGVLLALCSFQASHFEKAIVDQKRSALWKLSKEWAHLGVEVKDKPLASEILQSQVLACKQARGVSKAGQKLGNHSSTSPARYGPQK